MIYSLFPSLSHPFLVPSHHRNYLRIELESFPQTVVQLINHLPASFHGDRVICRVRQTEWVGGSQLSWRSEKQNMFSSSLECRQDIVCEAGKKQHKDELWARGKWCHASHYAAVGKTADSGSIMASFYDLKLKCCRPVMWLSPNVQPGSSVHDRMRFFKFNSHNLHKPEHSDSRGSSEATAAVSGSLKLEGNVRNLQLMFKLICKQIDCPVITAEKV